MSRRQIILLAKLTVAAGLLGWLVWRGTLNFRSLGIFFDHPALLVMNVVVFVGTFLVAAVRWRLLLQVAGVKLPLGRAVQLTFTGTFFNVVAPGNIGGEVVKAIYVARDAPPDRRPGVYLVGLLDRLFAVAGLVAVAVVLTLGARLVSGEARFGEATTMIVVLAIVTLVVPVVGLLLVRRYGDQIAGTGSSSIAKVWRRVIAAAQLVAHRPAALAFALCLSVAIHVVSIIWFSTVASAVLDQHVSVAQMAIVYPLGMLSVLLPISYAGFGVGQVALEQLFAMVGLRGGANVLTVYLIGQIVPCLFGVIPYLLLKRTAGAPSEAEVVA